MITQQLMASVIDSQRSTFLGKDKGIRREVFDSVSQAAGFASIITGIRRCGKSTLMMQILDKNKEDALFLNFEDPRLAGMDVSDFSRLDALMKQMGVHILFFDEIQVIKGWEIFIHQLLSEGYKIFITGSNASLLSKELGTHLTGRHLSTELFPFSYSEYLEYVKGERNELSIKDYLQKGGMPDYLRTGIDDLLNSLLDDILIRDIAIRHNIRDVRSLRRLCVLLMSNIGNPVSANKMLDLCGLKSTSTVLEYFSYLQDAYLLEFVPIFDYSLKKQIRNPKKVYATDLGVCHQNSIMFTENVGHILENAVYLHLRRKYKEIYYFQQEGECDFVAMHNGVASQLVQVCYDLNDMNIQRELSGLFNAMKYFKKLEGVIITMNQDDVFTEDGMTVKVLPAYKVL